jgi:hypothetical protein
VPRLSIMIPWWDANSASAFEDTLVSLLQHRPNRSELLVVHTHPYDDPYRVQDEGVRLLRVAAKSEIALINAGLQCVTAPVVHIVRCGVLVQEGWCDAALRALRDDDVAAVAPWIVQRQDPTRLAAGGICVDAGGERHLWGVGRQIQQALEQPAEVVSPLLDAGFYRRHLLLETGGFDESMGLLADIDTGLTWRKRGLHCLSLSASRVIGDVPRQIAAGFRTGRLLERLFWRHAPRHRRWRAVIGHWRSIAARSWRLLPSPAVVSELLGRLVGCWERSANRSASSSRQPIAGSLSAPSTTDSAAPATRRAA